MMRTWWLASYPKSGSTWVRLLLANLGRTMPAAINALADDGEIASNRDRFDRATLAPSALLTDGEVAAMRPEWHRAMASGRLDALFDRAAPIDAARFVKAHDAWTILPDGRALLGGAEAAAGAILIVRDPRAVAPSLAAHLGITIDAAIAMMAAHDAALSGSGDQLRQRLLDWSGHAMSWLGQREIPVHLVRYEDLHRDAARVLRALLAFAGISRDAGQCETAAQLSAFAQARRQEAAHGFREASQTRFFRQGLAEGWRTTLTEDQAARIVEVHADVMTRLGYEP